MFPTKPFLEMLMDLAPHLVWAGVVLAVVGTICRTYREGKIPRTQKRRMTDED